MLKYIHNSKFISEEGYVMGIEKLGGANIPGLGKLNGLGNLGQLKKNIGGEGGVDVQKILDSVGLSDELREEALLEPQITTDTNTNTQTETQTNTTTQTDNGENTVTQTNGQPGQTGNAGNVDVGGIISKVMEKVSSILDKVMGKLSEKLGKLGDIGNIGNIGERITQGLGGIGERIAQGLGRIGGRGNG
jgi:hypothetical protein